MRSLYKPTREHGRTTCLEKGVFQVEQGAKLESRQIGVEEPTEISGVAVAKEYECGTE